VRAALALAVAAALVVACGEKPQESSHKADSHPWENANAGFMANGYKAGDAAAWDTQIKQRTQGQNEYARVAVKP